jgi:hypothetical protein
MKFIFTFLVFLFFSSSIYSQVGGMRAYAGITSLVNKDAIANPEGHSHTGYHIGVDGRLMSGGMSFLVGGRYSSVSRAAIKDFKLSGHNSTLSVMNGRVGLDISIYSFSSIIRIRTKALASFDIVLSQGGLDLAPSGYNLNDGWAGLVTGIGADLGPVVIDIEYEFGVIKGYYRKDGSTFDSLSLSVGFFF